MSLTKIWTGPETGDPKPIIYLGGIVAGGSPEKALHVLPDIVRFQCLSYFYVGPNSRRPEICEKLWSRFAHYGTRAFLDSGAFSYQIEGIKKKRPLDQKVAATIIDGYVDWVYACPFTFDFIVTFDYQRDAAVEAWATKRIEARGLHPVPTYHYGSSLKVLRNMVERYSFIGIGGMVGTTNDKLYPFLDQVFNITQKYGVRLHGFGIGSAVTMFKYPWFCVDSTTWLACAAKSGQVARRSNDPRKIIEMVPVSSRRAPTKSLNGDSREERIRETWLTYDSLMRNPPTLSTPVKRGLF
jgi:hypothetical protein